MSVLTQAELDAELDAMQIKLNALAIHKLVGWHRMPVGVISSDIRAASALWFWAPDRNPYEDAPDFHSGFYTDEICDQLLAEYEERQASRAGVGEYHSGGHVLPCCSECGAVVLDTIKSEFTTCIKGEFVRVFFCVYCARRTGFHGYVHERDGNELHGKDDSPIKHLGPKPPTEHPLGDAWSTPCDEWP
jgi:hypothetical protein